nr:hypothetical protein [Dendronalium sp. ChiSLP03b]
MDADKEKLETCLKENEVRRNEIVAAMQQLESLLFKALGNSDENP